MRVSQHVEAEYAYHEDFEMNISAFHDDYTMCLHWSSITYFGTTKFETLPSSILNRYPCFYATPEGYKTVRTVAKCECAKNNGEAEVVSRVQIVRTRLGVTSKPSKASIYFAEIGKTPMFTSLLTPETLELGVPTQTVGTVILKYPGYYNATRSVGIVKGGKSEVYIEMTKRN